jgi:hypothetical protein
LTLKRWIPFCKVGDIVEFVIDVTPAPPDGKEPISITAGARYVATSIVEAGWDLRRVAGEGPDEVRILDSQISKYTRLVP